MQLKTDPTQLRRRLIAASCALLTTSAARSQEAAITGLVQDVLKEWRFESALAYYHENGRVQAVEPVVSANKDYGDGGSIGLNFTFDALSGSSPNGALPSHAPQTFASPSARSFASAKRLYTIAPGNLPVDPDYSDARVAVGGSWTLPLTRLSRLTLGGKVSFEDDFYSGSVNLAIAHDFNDKNTTVSFGVNDESDIIQPIGNTPVPLSDYGAFAREGNKSKNGVGALLGVTQVMTRTWLAQMNVSADRFSGYLNDPYKVVSVLDAGGNTTGYEYENRPGSRTRRSVYLENRVGWSRTSAALSLRYMTDTWGIHSDTAQVHFRWWSAAREQYVEPTVRWYRQSAADFFHPWLPSADVEGTKYVSADSRLAAFHAFTYGVKYGFSLGDKLHREGSEFTVRLEYYQQTLDIRTAAPAALQGLDLYPGLKAVMVQFGFSY
jgi:Protein of unknown function (DUF3570)